MGEAAKPWRFHLQVASYKLLPVTVRAEGGGGDDGWFQEEERKDVAVIIRKYLRYRIERVWAQRDRKVAVDAVKGKRHGGKKPMLFRASFRPVPSQHNILQPSLSNMPTKQFNLYRYTTTPNELVVDVSLE